MIRCSLSACLALIPFSRPAHAQAPASAIVGVVRDAGGGLLDGVTVNVGNRATSEHRTVLTSAAGTFRADQLPAGDYDVTASQTGFDTASVAVHLDVGSVRSADVVLRLSALRETATVVADAPRLDPERTGVATVIRRETIDGLPLNGRNALDLAAIVPGGAGPARASNNRLFLPTIGSGLSTQPRVGATRVTIDGADTAFIGSPGSAVSVSPDAVDAIQFSTSSFDAVTGLTASGAVNIVTRSGSNDPSGRLSWFWRDNAFEAYPSLVHDPKNPDPQFGRRQIGGLTGGPLVKNRAFAFLDVERTDQHGAVSIFLPAPFTGLEGIGSSPFVETLVTGRGDVSLTPRHHLTMESIGDVNHAISPGGAAVTSTLASGWANTTNVSSLNQITLTQVLSPAIVNDLHMSYAWMRSPESPADAADCASIGLPCTGLGGPQVRVADTPAATPLVLMGPARTLAFTGHRVELFDTLTWQRGSHRLRFGVDWERAVSSAAQDDRDPAQITVFTPARTAAAGLPTPATFMSADDLLTLPLQSVQVSVGPAASLERDFGPAEVYNSYRGFAADTWTVAWRVTASASLAVSDEPGVLNSDLPKPAWLAPLVGADHLGPANTHPQWAPAGGLTWAVTADGRTVARAAVGRYVDAAASTNPVNLQFERQALSPFGTGRLVGGVTVNPVTGAPLQFKGPSTTTGADLVGMLPSIRAVLAQSLNPDNRDTSVLNIDSIKQASDLTDSNFGQPSALHVNVGIERELNGSLTIGADGVWRRFSNTFITGIDENRWFSAKGAVIPACLAPQARNVAIHCSNNPITFDVTAGHARAIALLVHVDQRLARVQYSIAYTLSSYVGTNGTGSGTGFDNFNWLANVGPLPSDRRHVFNVSGRMSLPARLELGFNIAATSAPPFSAYLSGVDVDGDGTSSDLLPGSTVGAFGRSLDRDDLLTLVDLYNQNYAGRAGVSGPLPTIAQPSAFAFGDAFCTVDLRLTRTFVVGRVHFDAIAEVFNLFNTRNYTAFDANLLSPTFGQPTALASQIFGSGGPRAGQFGFRLSF
jgi:hypothetical protein